LIDPGFQRLPLTDQASKRDANPRVARTGTRRYHQEVATTLTEALEDSQDCFWRLAGHCGQFAEPSRSTHPSMIGVRIGETLENLGCCIKVLLPQSLVGVLRERMAQGPGSGVMQEVHGALLRFALPDVPRA